MTISVVIPALDEASNIVQAIQSVRPVRSEAGDESGSGDEIGEAVEQVEVEEEEVEVIVVDGGSRDETRRLARKAGARVLVSERGRARQLRLGSEHSSGDVILFLHADTRLESGWSRAVRSVLSDPGCAGGAFAFRFAERGLRQRVIEWAVALRVAVLGLPYGDQAIFVRRTVLEAMGGVPDVPIMEDLDLVAAIKRAGRLCILDRIATTSSRRYERRGMTRTLLQHQVALLGWWFGWDRRRLAERMGR